MVGAAVVGDVVGDDVVGDEVVGENVVGADVMGDNVMGGGVVLHKSTFSLEPNSPPDPTLTSFMKTMYDPLPYSQQIPSPHESVMVNTHASSGMHSSMEYTVLPLYDLPVCTIPPALPFTVHSVSLPYLSVTRSSLKLV